MTKDELVALFESGTSVEELVTLQRASPSERYFLEYHLMARALSDWGCILRGHIDYDRDWEPTEDARLRDLAAKGHSVDRIRKFLYRRPTDTQRRMVALGLIPGEDERDKDRLLREAQMIALASPWGLPLGRGRALLGIG